MNATVRGGSQVAAFFDIDGTLLARPSLEWQFFAELRRQKAIPWRNYFCWLARAVCLLPGGFAAMRHGNKMYLRGVSIEGPGAAGCGQPEIIAHKPRDGVTRGAPRFLTAATDRIAWHAQRGHAIVLVSGTLAPLALEVGLALVMRLAVRGVTAMMAVCATQLEERGSRWTGRIAGEPMFGEAKGRAVRRMISENKFDAQDCYAYGDNRSDCAMLEAVGQPVVVNPSWGLARIARQKKWPVLTWVAARNSPPSAPGTQSEARKAKEVLEKVG